MIHQAPTEGSVLAGRYRLVSQLGQGGMGTVWRAEHVSLGSPVAVKLMDIAASDEALARFRREAKAAAALQSPHVVHITDYGVEDGIPYIAMELLSGESLADRLERVGMLSPAETAKMLSHVSRALSKAHEHGIVHRDLKPDNIFVVCNDDDEIFKVLDFGIAKTTQSGLGASGSANTATGALIGTPYYMSPEQARGNKELGTASDIWSLGIIAFECLLGVRPFDSTAIGDLLVKICTQEPPVPSRSGCTLVGFDQWFARACAREPAERFTNAREMSDAFRSIVEKDGIALRASDPAIGAAPALSQASISPAVLVPTAPGVASSVVTKASNPMLSTGAWMAIGAGFVLIGGLALGGMLLRQSASSVGQPTSQASIPSPMASAVVASPPTPRVFDDAGSDSGAISIDSLPLASTKPVSGSWPQPAAPARTGSAPATPNRDKGTATTKPSPAKAGSQGNWGF